MYHQGNIKYRRRSILSLYLFQILITYIYTTKMGKYKTMTLPSTGPLKMSAFDVELGNSNSHQLSLSAARALADKLTGPIKFSDLYSKTLFATQYFFTSTTYTITGTVSNLKVLALGGGGGGSAQGAGGGGGQAFTTATFAVTTGDVITITVGLGGSVGARGANTTVQNSRTGQIVTGVGGYPGVSTTGGASIGPLLTTYYGGNPSGSNAGGGAGTGGAGGNASPSAGGTGAAAYADVLNSTTTIYVSAGGAGLTPSGTGSTATPNTGNGGDGKHAGASGLVVLFT